MSSRVMTNPTRSRSRFTLTGAVTILLFAACGFARPQAWSAQGHRLVALVATNHLSTAARTNVGWLLDGANLADVAVWADQYVADGVEGLDEVSDLHGASASRMAGVEMSVGVGPDTTE